MMGRPYFSIKSSTSLNLLTAPSDPGTTATPAAWAKKLIIQYIQLKKKVPILRALVLSPIISMTSGEGPTNLIPASCTLRAKVAFSDKKP